MHRLKETGDSIFYKQGIGIQKYLQEYSDTPAISSLGGEVESIVRSSK